MNPGHDERTPAAAKHGDEATLASMGYSQELFRGMGAFSNCALSFSIICILAGGITSFHVGFCAVGPAAVGIAWPVAALFSLAVAATMAQIASAFPTAGGLYHWAALLGGKGLGWFTAWFNLAGLVTVLAAINVGTWRFVVSSFFDGNDPGPWVQFGAVSTIALSQILINMMGMRVIDPVTTFSGYWIMGVSAWIVALLFWHGSFQHPSLLFEYQNFSGLPAGDSQVWPASESIAWMFFLAMLLPAYTITGFDASAHAAEETRDAAIVVPKSIIRAVAISGIAGWILLAIAVLTVADTQHIANQGEKAFATILEQAIPSHLLLPTFGMIVFAQYLCGLATVTSASRMAFAFARDGGLPFSGWLRQVSARYQVPVRSIWVVAIASVLFTIYADLYATIAAACTILLYVSYVMPTFAGLLAHGRTWTHMGPWQLGIWFKPLAILSLLGSAGVLIIGMQPPSEKAGWVVLGFSVLLGLAWLLGVRKSFRGPPVDLRSLQDQRP